MPAIASTAPGKVILFGEHAVVYGYPAIAVPVEKVFARAAIFANPLAPSGKVIIQATDINLEAELHELPEDNPLKLAIESVFKELEVRRVPAFTLRLNSDIPIASGMGSGAATAVAVIRAVANFLGHPLSVEKVSALAYAVEVIHHGTPSGIDNTVVAYAKPVFFQKREKQNQIEILPVRKSFTLIVADSGIRSPTSKAVGDVRQAWQSDISKYETLFDRVGQIVLQARQKIMDGHPHELGPLMNENQGILQEIGVSSPELDRLVEAARVAGAIGAKLSGAGRGGNMIALVDSENSDGIAAALKTAGAVRTITFEVSD